MSKKKYILNVMLTEDEDMHPGYIWGLLHEELSYLLEGNDISMLKSTLKVRDVENRKTYNYSNTRKKNAHS